ncbi:hypothetical protein EDD85DRAFT_795364 [Armillaria nabsnona]|nr:hypothetical protein EDD85DRAFT_795364 [Armillaria nabsnona]
MRKVLCIPRKSEEEPRGFVKALGYGTCMGGLKGDILSGVDKVPYLKMGVRNGGSGLLCKAIPPNSTRCRSVLVFSSGTQEANSYAELSNPHPMVPTYVAFMHSLHFTMRVVLNTQGTLTVVINSEEGQTVTLSAAGVTASPN